MGIFIGIDDPVNTAGPGDGHQRGNQVYWLGYFADKTGGMAMGTTRMAAKGAPVTKAVTVAKPPE